MKGRLVFFAFAVTFIAGCYSLQPAVQAPEIGTVVALDITDAGRVALGGMIGPEIGQVEGRLISAENGEYLIAVSSVRYLRGGEQIWAGERVRLSKEHVGNTYEKKFHKGRTIALGATVVAGITAIVMGTDLLGFATPGEREPPPDTVVTTRIPHPARIPRPSSPRTAPTS